MAGILIGTAIERKDVTNCTNGQKNGWLGAPAPIFPLQRFNLSLGKMLKRFFVCVSLSRVVNCLFIYNIKRHT